MAFQSFPVVSSQPCTTQPSSCNPSSNTRQGQAPYRDWKSSLTDCCADQQISVSCGTADCHTLAVLHTGLAGICGSFCPCILACQVSESLGECCCLPCLPGAWVATRTALREQHRIKGNVCKDWLATCCCCPCATCQMARELKAPC